MKLFGKYQTDDQYDCGKQRSLDSLMEYEEKKLHFEPNLFCFLDSAS